MAHSSRIAHALSLACELHGEQKRKASEIPYVTHLWAVAALVGEYGGNEAQIIAALLHDAVEDQGGEAVLTRIRDTFGDTVAGYVDACTDAYVIPKPPWRPRKEAYLTALRDKPAEVKLIAAADRIHNLRSMTRDYRGTGESLWDRFKGGRDGTLWFYDATLEALSDGWDHPVLDEYREALGNLRLMIDD